jgi:hypothetical protein
VDTGVKATANYMWRIRLSGGKMSFDYNNTTVWNTIEEIDWKYDDKHYTPALSIYTKHTTGDTVSIIGFIAYSDPYNYVTDFYREYIEQPTGRYEVIDGLAKVQPSKVTLNFNGHQALYGFFPPALSQTSVAFTWIGNSKLSINSLPNNLKIMLKNMQLESYDSYSGDREDILMSIPTLEFLNNRVSFNISNPVFIDINNAEPMNLTQLGIELKDFKGKYIEVEKEDFDITLLIRDRSEI